MGLGIFFCNLKDRGAHMDGAAAQESAHQQIKSEIQRTVRLPLLILRRTIGRDTPIRTDIA